MSVLRFLSPHMGRIYRENEGISTAEAAAQLRDILQSAPGADPAFEEELIEMGLKQCWGGFYGRVRQGAVKIAKRSVLRQTFTNGHADVIVDSLLQSMLPLPDGVRPLAHCSLIELRRSVDFLRQQRDGIGVQVRHTEAVADEMEIAVEKTGNTDLVVGEAHERGLIDWARVAAS